MIQVFLCGYYAPRMWRLSKEHDLVTPGDMFDSFYQSRRLRYLVAITDVAFMVPTLIAQNQGMGKALETLSGGAVPYWAAALYCCLLVGIYVFFGGFRSQAWVDTAQGFFFLFTLWGSLLLVLFQPNVGGIANLYKNLEAYNHSLLTFDANSGSWGIKFVIGFMAVQFLGGNVCAPYGIQRFFCAKSGKDLVKTFKTLGIMAGIGVLFPLALVGLSGNLFDISYASNDSVFLSICNYISPWWGVIVTLAILAAGMSTVSSNLISCSSVVTVDLVGTMSKNMDDKKKLRIGKVVTAALIVVAYLFSLVNVAGIVTLLNISFAGYAMSIIPIFGMFHYSKRVSEKGAFWGLFTAVALTSLFTAIPAIKNPLGFHAGLWGLVCGFIVFFIVCAVTKPVPQAHRTAYFSCLKKSKKYAETYIPE